MDDSMTIKVMTFEASDINALRAIAIDPLVSGLPSYVIFRLIHTYGAVRVGEMIDDRGRPGLFTYHLTERGVQVLDIADRTGHSFVSIPIQPD